MPTTKVVTRQIADGAITKEKIPAGAGIETSKLEDGTEFIKRDGTILFTGDINLGNQRITNLNTPSLGTDGVNKNYVDTAIANLNSLFDSKASVRIASTANITIASPGSSIDGVVLVNGDRVLLKNQNTSSQNGLYLFNGSSSPMTRTTDMDTWAEVPGAFLAVEEGTGNADTVWLCTANSGGTIGTNSIPWQQIPTTAGLLSSNFIKNETPSGTQNGSNVDFTLAFTPVTGTQEVYLNGVLQDLGSGNDYTISSTVISFAVAPISTDKIRVHYIK